MTQQTVTHQAPLSMRFSRQEFCGGSPCFLWGIFPTQGSNPCLLHLLHWWTDSLPLYHLIIHLLSHLSFTKVLWGKYCWIPLYRRESGDTVLSSSQQRKVRARIWTRQYRMKLFSCSVMSNSLRPHGLQHTRLPVHHQLLEFAQTCVLWVSGAIQPSQSSLCIKVFSTLLTEPVGQFAVQIL